MDRNMIADLLRGAFLEFNSYASEVTEDDQDLMRSMTLWLIRKRKVNENVKED